MRSSFLAFLLIASAASPPNAQPVAAPPPARWDLPRQYPNEEAWNGSLTEVERRLAAFDRRRDTAIISPAQLADLLDEARFLRGRAGNMARFALLTSAMDTRDDSAKARLNAATALEAKVEGGVSWLDRATSELGRERLERWRKSEQRLARHGWELNAAILNSSHSYPARTEAPYAVLERARLTASETYDSLMAADLGWPHSVGEGGISNVVDPDSFADLSTSRDKQVRRGASEAFYGKLKTLEPALGTLLTRRLELDRAMAKARGFDNGTDAFFWLSDGLPQGAYRTMIAQTRANRAVLARYVRTLARLNQLPDVRYSDLAVNAPDYPRSIQLDEAIELTLASMSPMGPHYQQTLRDRFAEPWFDLPARPNKGGGANGIYWGVGGGHPYGFISFRPTLSGARSVAAVATLTMFYADLPSNKAPVRREDDFPIYGNAIWFIGPLLQTDYLYARAHSREERVALLASDLRRLWSVYFGGVVITDFTNRLEAKVAAGQPLTGPQISALYLSVLRDYYAQSGAQLSDADGEGWMSLPNLFYGHVWDEWSFAMAAAVAMTEGVKSGDAATISAITSPMNRPNSYSSYDMLRDANADPTDTTIYEAVIRRMTVDMDRLDRELH